MRNLSLLTSLASFHGTASLGKDQHRITVHWYSTREVKNGLSMPFNCNLYPLFHVFKGTEASLWYL